MKFEWATPEWFEAVVRSGKRLQPTPGVAFRSQYVISGSPKGDVAYVESVEDGRVVRGELGEGPSDMRVSMSYPDYQRMVLEQIPSHQLPSARVEGDTSRLAPLAPIFATPEFKAHRQYIIEMTEWPA